MAPGRPSAAWLVDRCSGLEPGLAAAYASVEPVDAAGLLASQRFPLDPFPARLSRPESQSAQTSGACPAAQVSCVRCHKVSAVPGRTAQEDSARESELS